MVAADARTAIVFALSPGHDLDAAHGRELLEELGPMPEGLTMLMDRPYEGNETWQTDAYRTGGLSGAVRRATSLFF
jgi:hypothetical protein